METAIYMLIKLQLSNYFFCKGFINESIFYDQNHLAV